MSEYKDEDVKKYLDRTVQIKSLIENKQKEVYEAGKRRGIKLFFTYQAVAIFITAVCLALEASEPFYVVSLAVALTGCLVMFGYFSDEVKADNVHSDVLFALSTYEFKSITALDSLKNSIKLNESGEIFLAYEDALIAIEAEMVFLHRNNSFLMKSINKNIDILTFGK